jgi:hypothetical protein
MPHDHEPPLFVPLPNYPSGLEARSFSLWLQYNYGVLNGVRPAVLNGLSPAPSASLLFLPPL